VRVLLIDNYDSFTFNLCQYLEELNASTHVVRNDDDWDTVIARPFDAIVISPGPGRPERNEDFGISARALATDLPVLGVCLGHQGMAHAAGARVIHAPVPMHGRVSRLFHAEHPLFRGIPQGSEVVRYHSLLVASPLPPSCETIAWTEDGLIMALAHRERFQLGVQFHPESIATVDGKRLLENFLDLVSERTGCRRNTPRRFAHETKPPPDSNRRIESRRLPKLFDPEAIFVDMIADKPYGFWLDNASSEPGRGGRFSFLGAVSGSSSFAFTYSVADREVSIHRNERTTRRRDEELFDFISKTLGDTCESPELPFDFNGGLVGYLGYELKAECGGEVVHKADTPDAGFIFADRMIVLDHHLGATYLVAIVDGDGLDVEAWFAATEQRLEHMPHPAPLPDCAPAEELAFMPARDRDAYRADIFRCLREITDGETYEVCLTTQFQSDVDLDPVLFYRLLRKINPSGYCSYLRFGDVAIASSSPERFIRVDRDRVAESKPIKGTRRRGATKEMDRQLRHDLQTNEKDRAENLMIVDLMRNDLGQCCEVGSVSVPVLMRVETYSTVHQLVSTIRGQLKPDVSSVDAIRAAFPGGSMTGAPKRRTMRLIDDIETTARGVYSGAIGFFALNGTADLSIVIRTAVLTPGKITFGAGGAIVAQSDPEEEWAEVVLKTGMIRKAAQLCWNTQRAFARQVPSAS
jgi:para-aminobenzoate synthetase